MREVLLAGAEKVSVNSAAVRNPEIIAGGPRCTAASASCSAWTSHGTPQALRLRCRHRRRTHETGSTPGVGPEGREAGGRGDRSELHRRGRHQRGLRAHRHGLVSRPRWRYPSSLRGGRGSRSTSCRSFATRMPMPPLLPPWCITGTGVSPPSRIILRSGASPSRGPEGGCHDRGLSLYLRKPMNIRGRELSENMFSLFAGIRSYTYAHIRV